jgi:hypothetical protein
LLIFGCPCAKIPDFSRFSVPLKLALSMHRICDVRHFNLSPDCHFSGGVRMKLRTIFTAAALTALFAAAPVVSYAHDHDGDWDEHHEWHDAHWWHDNHPGWIYSHHPEWVTVYPEWRTYDGDYDEGHVWHDRGWWYNNHPEWVREHHHDWARWRD